MTITDNVRNLKNVCHLPHENVTIMYPMVVSTKWSEILLIIEMCKK